MIGIRGVFCAATVAAVFAGVAARHSEALTVAPALPGHLAIFLENASDPSDEKRIYIGNLFRDEPIDVVVTLDRPAGTVDVTGSGEGFLYNSDAHVTAGPPSDPTPIQATFDFSFSGIDFDTDPVTGETIVAIGRSNLTAMGEGTVELSGASVGGGLVTLDFVDKSKFDTGPNTGTNTWGIFGADAFNLFLGTSPGIPNLGFDEQFAAWFMPRFPQTLTLGGITYNVLQGDVHGRMPEPTTMALVATALAAAGSRRRR
ncbi:MAG: PEP-CTERM sorting domain-containing protein [Planctomycetota bacterium]